MSRVHMQRQNQQPPNESDALVLPSSTENSCKTYDNYIEVVNSRLLLNQINKLATGYGPVSFGSVTNALEIVLHNLKNGRIATNSDAFLSKPFYDILDGSANPASRIKPVHKPTRSTIKSFDRKRSRLERKRKKNSERREEELVRNGNGNGFPATGGDPSSQPEERIDNA